MDREKKRYVIIAPLSGTFYRRPSPDEDPFVEVGDHVEPRTIVCIVETMKVFNDVRSEMKGVIKKILVEDEDTVMIHEPLMELEIP